MFTELSSLPLPLLNLLFARFTEDIADYCSGVYGDTDLRVMPFFAELPLVLVYLLELMVAEIGPDSQHKQQSVFISCLESGFLH